MTQDELADVLNVSKRQVQNFEGGITIPWKYFQTMETVFKRPLSWFLHGEEEPGEGDEAVSGRLERIELMLEELVARLGQDDEEEEPPSKESSEV